MHPQSLFGVKLETWRIAVFCWRFMLGPTGCDDSSRPLHSPAPTCLSAASSLPCRSLSSSLLRCYLVAMVDWCMFLEV